MSSRNNHWIGISLMLCSALCAATGQLFWKLSASSNTMFLTLGFILYAIGALLMIGAYRFGSLSLLQPILASSYVVGFFYGWALLGEDISLTKFSGLICILMGVFLISRSRN